MDFKAQIQETIDELKSNGQVQLAKAKLAKPVPSYAISSLTASGFALPEPLLEFYKAMDGFHLHWKNADKKIQGELFIQPLVQTFSITWKNKLWFDWMQEEGATETEAEHYRLAKSLKGFDVLDETLSGTTIVALQIPEKGSKNESDFQTIFWDSKGVKFPVVLSPTGYIQQGLKYVGIMDWQLFFVDWQALKNQSSLWQELFLKLKQSFGDRMEAALHNLKKLFPEMDLSEFNESKNLASKNLD